MQKDRVYLKKVLRSGLAYQCIKIGNYSAIKYAWIYVMNVLVMGIVQQCNKVEYTTTMYQCRV